MRSFTEILHISKPEENQPDLQKRTERARKLGLRVLKSPPGGNVAVGANTYPFVLRETQEIRERRRQKTE